MRIVVITHSVKAADAYTPAAILVPAEGLDIAGFHCDDRGTDVDRILKMNGGINGDKEAQPNGWAKLLSFFTLLGFPKTIIYIFYYS